MAPKPKGQPHPGKPRNRDLIAAANKLPVVPLEKVQKHAAELRSEHPDLDDDTVALVTLLIHTQKSNRAICRELKCSHAWAATRLRRPAVQRFMAELALAALGVAAARSIQTMSDLTRSDDENMRYKAAAALQDRAGLGNHSSAQAGHSGPGYSFTFGPPPKEQP
jgi:hypothetical protein